MKETDNPPSEDGRTGESAHAEEDQSYAKSSLGSATDEEQGVHKVLGVQWDVTQDSFHFDIGDVAHKMENSEPTKRGVVSITVRFFDPLGVVSPVTILFKMFCQQLCEARISWVEPLSGSLRSTYWLVRGRQFVRKMIHGCVSCRKMEGKPCQGVPPPPLPEYRVQ